jgi:Putative addiction module component
MNEIVFQVEENNEGGFTARAVGESIFAEGDNLESLRENIRDAVNCYFEPDKRPEFLQLQIRDSSLTEDQKAELDRRLEEHRKNPNDTIPWEVVKENLRRRYPD